MNTYTVELHVIFTDGIEEKKMFKDNIFSSEAFCVIDFEDGRSVRSFKILVVPDDNRI